MTAPPDGAPFLEQWNTLAGRDRRRLRRLARLGRPIEDAREAGLAVGYARFQRTRIWSRLFWLWFVPGMLMALAIGSQLHPIAIGVVLALGAQAVFARRNLGRAERIYEPS